MLLDWKKMCFEDVLDYHPDRLADNLANYLGWCLEEYEKEPIKINDINNALMHDDFAEIRYSIDVVLARENVHIYVEYNPTKEINDEIIHTILLNKTKKFFYDSEDLDKCLNTDINSLKIQIFLFKQSPQLAEKSRFESNDNCIINFFDSPILDEIREVFRYIKEYLKQFPLIARDGKIIIKYDDEKKRWICYLTICFLTKNMLAITVAIQKIEKHKQPYKFIVVNKWEWDLWYAPASFMCDVGVTGRKLQSDFFYGLAPHQQGSIHGKDRSKYDRFIYEKYLNLSLEQSNDEEKAKKHETFISETWLSGDDKPLNRYEETIKIKGGNEM